MSANCTLKQDLEEVIISTSAIRRALMKHRKLLRSEVKEIFSPAFPIIFYLDGKVMDDFTGQKRGKVDSLPILVSGQDVVKL